MRKEARHYLSFFLEGGKGKEMQVHGHCLPVPSARHSPQEEKQVIPQGRIRG